MRKPLFSSITALVVAGFIAAALPLVVAVTSAALQVRKLGRQAEQSVVQSVQAARETESITNELASMERNARQFQVLGDEAIREIYLRRQDNVMSSIARLEASSSAFASSVKLNLIKEELDGLHRAITADNAEAALSVALPAFQRIHTAANNIRQTSQDAMDAKLAALSAEAANTQTTLIWQTVALGLIGLVLSALFVRAILRPVGRINETITRLGEERYEEEIAIGGPRDLQQIGERLEWLARRLSELEGLKNEFMRHMSHELKTPLANIRESVALLKDETVGTLGAAQHEIIDILDKSSSRLKLLIDNLLDFSQWKEQHSSLKLQTFSMIELVEDVIDEHYLAMENRKLRLERCVSDDLVITADRDRIRTLLTNLISNAIKYSPPGGKITIGAVPDDGRLAIDVVDEGPGIPRAERQLVFKPFFQSTGSRLISVEGTGIGLSLVQECIHAHGGKGEFLDVDRGSHFRATLPVVTEEATH